MATPAILQEDRDPHRDRDTSPPAPPKKRKPQRVWLHLLLFVATICTTTAVGMRYMANFRQGLYPLTADTDIFPYSWAWDHLHLVPSGLPFSLSLLAILLTHEFGHYFACRIYGIKATLPLLLPAPSLSGTAGAVIRLRGRVQKRDALLAIGALGPIPGFLVAVVVACVGISLSHMGTKVPDGLVDFQLPWLLRILARAMGHPEFAVANAPVLWHPVFIAAWVGTLITALNLIPAGQLDGGHILYAFSPRLHHWMTRITMIALGILGIVFWVGWLIWLGLLLLPGMRHPSVQDTTPLQGWQKLMGLVCLGILILCAVHEPFDHASPLQGTIHLWQQYHHE